ncbi:MAG: hypothetical protein N2746_06020 [Deltaproteobacteria bacterium]|nr:hypothetical protein [Deltaproteobacteria bacterium]
MRFGIFLFVLFFSAIVYSEPFCVESKDIDGDCKGILGDERYKKILKGEKVYCCEVNIEGIDEVKIIKKISIINRLEKQFNPDISILCDGKNKDEFKGMSEYLVSNIRECVIKQVESRGAKDILFDFLMHIKLTRITSGYFKNGYVVEKYENSSYSESVLYCGKNVITEFLRDINKSYEFNVCRNIELNILFVDDYIGGFKDIEEFHKKIMDIKKERMPNSNSGRR